MVDAGGGGGGGGGGRRKAVLLFTYIDDDDDDSVDVIDVVFKKCKASLLESCFHNELLSAVVAHQTVETALTDRVAL